MLPVAMTPRFKAFTSMSSRRVGRAAVVAFLVLGGTTACGSSSSPTAPSAATPPVASPPASTAFSEASFRMAAQITATAQIDVFRAVRPGLLEGDLKRVVDAAFQRAGAAPAFAHIVASGPNALVSHYEGDSRQLADGDAVMVDIGAAFDEHCSDVSRTYAVSGIFTARQREIYQLVLDVQQTVAAEARPGDYLTSLEARARALFRSSTLRGRKNQVAGLLPMDQFFVHALSHFVGRRVHGEDTGLTKFDPLRPGHVLTIEPGIYIELEGLGVRIEDTYLVTATGLECLTCACPKQLRDIERGM